MTMLQHLVAAMVIVSMVPAARADQPPKNGFTVRCLNKDSVLYPEKQGELNLKVECLVVVEREIQLKPGDFRLALLDAKLRQQDEIAIAIPADWKTKTFKKGANRDTLTMNLQGGEFVAGREYYLAIMISDRGADGVFPVFVRFVKFKVSNVGPGRTDDNPQRVPPPIKQPMPETKELPKGVVAAENEAEKLFRDLEQRVRKAKTLQIRFDATITGAEAKKPDDKRVDAKHWHVKGCAILGEGDKFRAEYEGNSFGQESKRTFVSDGTHWMQFGYTKNAAFEGSGTERTPKAIGAYLRPALPRDGFVLCFITDRRSQLAPDHFIIADFKLAGAEKIGERNTQVIQYTLKAKGKDPSFGAPPVNVTTMKLSMKIWLDTKTKLPVKLAMTGGDSSFNAITETYSEFTIDAKVDAKLFVLPKGPAPAPKERQPPAGKKPVDDAKAAPLSPSEMEAEARAIGALGKLGGTCTTLADVAGKPVVGVQFVAAPIRLAGFGYREMAKDGLKEFKAFTRLKSLKLDRTDVTDDSMKELKDLKSLQSLDVAHTRVTDAGLKPLKELQGLQALVLGGTAVTDAGISELMELKSLQWLDLSNTRVTDAGLKELAGLKSLQTLNVMGTRMTDAGYAELRKLRPKLKVIR